MAFLAQVVLDSLRCAMSGQEQGPSIHLLRPRSSRGTSAVHIGEHVRIMNQIPQDREGSLPGQLQCQVNGVAHAKAHTEVIGRPHFHRRLLCV